MSHHNRSKQPEEDDDDPLDKIIRNSGCADLHYKVQVQW